MEPHPKYWLHPFSSWFRTTFTLKKISQERKILHIWSATYHWKVITYFKFYLALKYLLENMHNGLQLRAWGDASDQNWKYRFTQRDLSAVSNGVISCHIKRCSAVSSLPRRHLEYVAVRSVSSLLGAYKNILSYNLMRLKIGLQLRQIWKVSRS